MEVFHKKIRQIAVNVASIWLTLELGAHLSIFWYRANPEHGSNDLKAIIFKLTSYQYERKVAVLALHLEESER